MYSLKMEPGFLKQQTEADPGQIVGVQKNPGSICKHYMFYEYLFYIYIYIYIYNESNSTICGEINIDTFL